MLYHNAIIPRNAVRISTTSTVLVGKLKHPCRWQNHVINGIVDIIVEAMVMLRLYMHRPAAPPPLLKTDLHGSSIIRKASCFLGHQMFRGFGRSVCFSRTVIDQPIGIFFSLGGDCRDDRVPYYSLTHSSMEVHVHFYEYFMDVDVTKSYQIDCNRE